MNFVASDSDDSCMDYKLHKDYEIIIFYFSAKRGIPEKEQSLVGHLASSSNLHQLIVNLMNVSKENQANQSIFSKHARLQQWQGYYR